VYYAGIKVLSTLYQWFQNWGMHAPWVFPADRLRVCKNNIGNGGKHKKKGVKMKMQKQSYKVLVYKE
jgi:hypothetical protein